MITGVHALIYTPDAEKLRAFFKDVLGLDSVDAGGGWPIFALPPAELGIHPSEGAASHELYLLCDNLEKTMKELRAKGVRFAGSVGEESWGKTTRIELPDGGRLGLYQPKHPLAHGEGAVVVPRRKKGA